MNIQNAFPSKYIKSSDLQGKRIKLQILSVSMEEVGDGEKPVMYFVGKQKAVVMNKTNSLAVAVAFGDDTIKWQGREIELFAHPVMFQGRQVMGLAMAPVGLSTPAAAPVQDFDRSARGDAPSGPHDFVAPAEAELQDQNAGFDDIPF